MKRLDLLGMVTLAIGAGFVGQRIAAAHRPLVRAFAGQLGAPMVTADGGTVAPRLAEGGGDLTDPAHRDVTDVRLRLRRGARGTYIDELLLARDSALARWPDRRLAPLRVWIRPWFRNENWDPEFVPIVREAFEQWMATGIPLRFEFVRDSARADVHVSWTDRFTEPISGRTLWARDESWWIVDASVLLALHHRGGDPLDRSSVRAIALHEIGHLIGLDHTADTANIMTPRVRVRELSAADRATAQLLYVLPPGTIR